MLDNEIDELLKNLKKQNNKRRSIIDAEQYLKQLKGEINTDKLNDTIRQINKEIESDFGVKINDSDFSDKADFDKIEQYLNGKLIGQKEFIHDLIIAFKRPYVVGHEETKPTNSIIVSGSRGTGKHTAINIIAQQMHVQKLVPSNKVKYIDCSLYSSAETEKLLLQDLYSALSSTSNILVFEKIEQLNQSFITYFVQLVSEGKMQLSKRYILQNNQLVETNNSLISEVVSTLSSENKYMIFLTDSSSEKLSQIFGSSFIRCINDIASTQHFNVDDINSLARLQSTLLMNKCKERLNYEISVEESFIEYLTMNYKKEEGVYSIIKICDTCFDGLASYKLERNTEIKASLAYNKKILLKIGEIVQYLDDFLQTPFEEEGIKIKDELNEIVGLNKVKEYILSLENNVKIQRMRQAHGLKNADVTMHMIFTGNPGTGKTTIARIVAKYLKAMGVIDGGQLVEVTRADLVGKYVGHTAPLTTKVIESALGGVLFIDEAYSLYRGKDDSFGLEAIDTLVKGMEDYRDNLIVILAGYTREMNEFLESNSGLRSRFPNKIEFDDYTADELLQIAKSIAKSKDYSLNESCDKLLLDYFELKQAEDSRRNGNGRMARNCIEDAILKQANRVLNSPDAKIDELVAEDFVLK